MMGDLSNTIIDGDPFDINEGGEGGGGFDPTSLSLSTQTPVAADEIITGESGGTWVRKTLAKMKEYFLTVFTGATDLTDGTSGQVPKPLAGDQNKFLTGGAGWEDDTSKLITNFTSSDNASETGIITSSGGETSMTAMTSGDTHGGLFGGLSKVVLNTRKLINSVKSLWSMVGNQWVTGESVQVGYYRFYNGKRYRCKQAHTTSTSILPTNTTYWTEQTVNQDLYALNSNYTNIINAFSKPNTKVEVSSNSTYTLTAHALVQITMNTANGGYTNFTVNGKGLAWLQNNNSGGVALGIPIALSKGAVIHTGSGTTANVYYA